MVIASGAPAACSSGEDGESAPVPEERPTSSTTTSSPPTTLSNDDYAATIDQFGAAVDAAGTDFCALMEAFTAGPSVEPSSPEQVRSIVEGTSRFFTAMTQADGIDAQTAASLQEMAQLLTDEAAAAGYSPSVLSAQSEDSPLQDPAYGQVLGDLVSRAAQECVPAAEGAG